MCPIQPCHADVVYHVCSSGPIDSCHVSSTKERERSLMSFVFQLFPLYSLFLTTLGLSKELNLLRSYKTAMFQYHFSLRSSSSDIKIWNAEASICHFRPALKIICQGLHVPSFDIPKSRYIAYWSFRYQIPIFGLPCDFGLRNLSSLLWLWDLGSPFWFSLWNTKITPILPYTRDEK